MKRKQAITEGTLFGWPIVVGAMSVVGMSAMWAGYTQTIQNTTSASVAEIKADVTKIKEDVVQIKTLLEVRDALRNRSTDDSDTEHSSPGIEDEDVENLSGRFRLYRLPDALNIRPPLDVRPTKTMDDRA